MALFIILYVKEKEKVPKHCAMKTHGGADVKLLTFLTLKLYGILGKMSDNVNKVV
jgi:hypothetical protein